MKAQEICEKIQDVPIKNPFYDVRIWEIILYIEKYLQYYIPKYGDIKTELNCHTSYEYLTYFEINRRYNLYICNKGIIPEVFFSSVSLKAFVMKYWQRHHNFFILKYLQTTSRVVKQKFLIILYFCLLL